jgi:PAS domain S-box-containing protein
MPAFSSFLAGSIGWITWRLERAPNLERAERRTLIVSLLIYGAMCTTNIAATLGMPVAPLGELAPAVVAVGASGLVARRQHRLESDLAALVAQKTSQLSENEARFRELVENSKIGIASVDRSGGVLAVTPRMYEMFELPFDSASPPANLHQLPLTQNNGTAALVQHVIEREKAVSVETRHPTALGRHLDVHAIVAPQRGALGDVNGALILIEDVTEQRAIEVRLRQSQKMESVGELASGIARGITAPMETVRDNLARVREVCDAVRKQLAPRASEQQRERFGEIEDLVDEAAEGVQRALGIVSDMREISQGGSLANGPVDLNELLAGVVRMAGTQKRGAKIVERYADLPRITGNAGQLRQVFLNLVVNAVQAAPPGGRVEIESARAGDRVRVTVRDDGPGISPEHRDRLFEPFFTTKPPGQGTGLGLFLSYQIVQSHRGEIRFCPEVSAGAAFEVSLPIDQAPASEPAA